MSAWVMTVRTPDGGEIEIREYEDTDKDGAVIRPPGKHAAWVSFDQRSFRLFVDAIAGRYYAGGP